MPWNGYLLMGTSAYGYRTLSWSTMLLMLLMSLCLLCVFTDRIVLLLYSCIKLSVYAILHDCGNADHLSVYCVYCGNGMAYRLHLLIYA